MDPADRDVITKNYTCIAEFINLPNLLPFLILNKIFTRAMVEDLWCMNATELEKACELLLELRTRGPNAFENFIQALQLSGQSEAVLFLQSRADATKVNVGGMVAEMSVIPATEWKRGKGIYKMTSEPRGYCLIINNVKFDTLERRDGSDVDAIKLDRVFQQLGYYVYIKNNKKAEEMKKLLSDFAAKPEHKNVDSCVVVILSHGKEDGIYGTDGVGDNILPICTITEMFDNYNCPNLKSKPKMFFLQACRGRNPNVGVSKLESSDSVVVHKNKVNPPQKTKERIPTRTDMLISYATTQGNLAIRNHCFGSWYCLELTRVLCLHACNTDLLCMLVNVDGNVKQYISNEGDMQATAFSTEGWSDRLYFNPGLCEG